MKRQIVLSLLLIIATASVKAETFSLAAASVAAGGTVDVQLSLSCVANKWGGFQFDMRLPEGVTIMEDEEGFYCVQEDRLSFTNRGKTEYFGIDVGHLEDGTYRFLIDNNRGKTIPGTDGALMTIRLLCDASVATKDYSISIFNQKISNVDGSESTMPADNPRAGELNVRVDVEVGATGYASFSWPLATDFSDTGLQVYIATSYNNGSLHLEPVTNVPAETGVILVGDAGVYHPSASTSAGLTDDVSANVLSATAEAPVIAPANSRMYGLASNDGITGFYHIREGVRIPQFKAYLELSDDAGVRSFVSLDGIATGISRAAAATSGAWFHVDGTINDKPRKGVNINQGQKIFIK